MAEWDNKLTLICKFCNHKQEIVQTRTVITGVSVIKRLNLYEFGVCGRDLVSVVRIREGPYYRGFLYREYMGILPGPRELSVLEKCP